MAQDGKKPTTEEKGKGKAPATDGVNGIDGKKEPKKDKDGKIIEDDAKIGAEGMSRCIICGVRLAWLRPRCIELFLA